MRTGLQVVSASLRTIKASRCGECKECCIAFPICDGDIDKPGNEPCKHLGDHGCNIYDNRPATWQIEWLLTHLRSNYNVGEITRHPFGSIV
jgi:hypothetical protein